ncbi:Uncharacterised protein [Mycobacterium tuberculosis]|nr:Uncharacterised protein [Mycobacterium tuberculosis]
MRQGNSASLWRKQDKIQFLLQLAYLCGYSWLADRQGIGSGGDTAFGGDFYKNSQCVQVHHFSPFISIAYE